MKIIKSEKGQKVFINILVSGSNIKRRRSTWKPGKELLQNEKSTMAVSIHLQRHLMYTCIYFISKYVWEYTKYLISQYLVYSAKTISIITKRCKVNLLHEFKLHFVKQTGGMQSFTYMLPLLSIQRWKIWMVSSLA